ncbi:alpha-galactosidase D [Tunturiibacter gelidoferens]|uniref:Alpha-galactosidase n=1 Tax=Tunturiibacter gelidiferens TaxID=3069689 RepID=A0AAU7YWT7_9BACT
MTARMTSSIESKISNLKHQHGEAGSRYLRVVFAICFAVFFGCALGGRAQTPGIAEKPYQGWSSFSQQTISSNFLTQANMTAQSDALFASGLQGHGFNYINMDSGWQGSFDANGRPIPNSTIFPDITALVAHIHTNGQKAGIYWIPGVEYPAVVANSTILGTPYHIQDILAVPYTAGNAFGAPGTSPYHYKIDFTKPGAQEYINSVVNLFASWGIDAIKLDAVTPGSYSDDLSIDNRADVAAWAEAIAQSGRPIWFTISWALDQDYLSVWQQFANARRIEGDIDCEGNCSTITNWAMASWRFYDLVGWQNAAGPLVGWNDLDSLEVMNNTTSGLSYEERRSIATLWAMANAPMYLGGDLTTLDAFGKQLLTNDEVIAIDQSAHPAKQALGGDTPVWVSDMEDGNYYVALFNLNAFPSRVVVPWNSLGFAHASRVRDLWNHIELGSLDHGFDTTILGHGVRLLKVTGEGRPRPTESQSYEAEAATLSGTAVIAACSACSGGEKVGGLALGWNNAVTFNNVATSRTGVYQMQIDSLTQGPRSLIYQVNGGPLQTLNVGGGSFFLPSSTTVSVALNKGINSIKFGSPTSYPPDMDRIVVSGDGSGTPPLPSSTTFEAENATLAGTVTPPYCEYCSGADEAGNIGGGSGNTVTFTQVNVAKTGTYLMEVDYLTAAPRSFFISVNGGANTELDLNGSSWNLPASTVIPVQLQAGSNTIQFGNDSGYAPALDRIAIAPAVESPTLTGAIASKTGGENLRVWKIALTNSGSGRAQGSQLNTFSVTQAGGDGACHPKVIEQLPIELNGIAPGGHAVVDVPIDFSKCGKSATFNVNLVFSSDNGADVGDLVGTAEPR